VNPCSRRYAALFSGSLLIAAMPAPAPTQTQTQAQAQAAATTSPAGPAASAPPCEACHGAHGEGMAAAHVPRLAGQSAGYLLKQLNDYAQGTRDNPIMRNFAKALSEKQRIEFAARYAAMSAPFTAQTTPLNEEQLARGHQLAFQGSEVKRVQACDSCHGPDGVGVDFAAPYLAGQSAEYLASAIKAFQQGTRKNDAGELMRSVAQGLDDADIAAVTGYYATQGTATH